MQSQRIAALAAEISVESNVEIGLKTILDAAVELLAAEHVLVYGFASTPGGGFEVMSASKLGKPPRHSSLAQIHYDLSLDSLVGSAALVRCAFGGFS